MMAKTSLSAFLRMVRVRLGRGFVIPALGIQITIDIHRTTRNGKAAAYEDDSVAGSADILLEEMARKIVVGQSQAVMSKVPQLRRFHRPEFDADIAAASAFLNFLNDTIVLFHPSARGVHLRRQLVRLKDRQPIEAVRTAIDREIAISDLEDGVVERALQLLGDPNYGDRARSDMEAFDAHYGALPPFLSIARKELDLSRDVRGNSLLWHLKRNTEIFAGKRILHVAPEAVVEKFLRSAREQPPLRYETLDGFSSTVDHLQDLTALGFEDNAYDLIICHRVLEHIIDDIGAMESMYRILAAGGVLDISVPQSMNLEVTNEWIAQDSSHHDHVRQYGRDFEDRLRSVGFLVETDRQLLEKPLAEHREDGSYPMRHYICRKPEQGDSPVASPQAAMP